ncbi:MAG: hypothetical protein LQ349_006326 [Xanthoria aureola]|nr:MAG: hypothetical protein LQ349_006326 [Xanthoria aureola]
MVSHGRSPPWTKTLEPQQFRACRPPRKAWNLVMQLDPSTDGLMSNQVTVQASQWLRRFREMRTLQMDFRFPEHRYKTPRKHGFRNEKHRTEFTEWIERPFSESMTNAPGKPPRLQQLNCGGLLCDEISVGLIKTWARFVIPDGIIGVSCGFGGGIGDGKRDDTGRTVQSYPKTLSSHNMAYRRKYDLDGWIFSEESGYTMQITCSTT